MTWIPPELRFYTEEDTMESGSRPHNAHGDEKAQRILDMKPEGAELDLRQHSDTMREIAKRERVSVAMIRRIWTRKTYNHLRWRGSADAS